MGKQQNIIKAKHEQILNWQKQCRPTDWIARQIKVSRGLLKSFYPHYKGSQGGHAKNKEINYNLNPIKCKNCSGVLTWKHRKQKFCTLTCSTTFNNKLKQRKKWTPEQRLLQSIRIKNRLSFHKSEPLLETKVCCVCSKNFEFNRRKVRLTCGRECLSNLQSKNSSSNPNCGGETNYKKYFYKNIIMDSSWEVELAKYLDSKNIRWERSRKLILFWTDSAGNKRRYYPDFYLPLLNVYLDPKNKYKLKQDTEKLEKVVKENNIVLFFGSLKEIILNLEGYGTARRGRLICNE
jgi:hypothetical protein